MTIVLCDDQPIYLREASGILKTYAEKNDMSFEIVTFTDSAVLCEQDDVVPDILFLDIRMDGQDGIETGRRVNLKWRKCRIVYLTDYISYATDVYQTEHVYYVLKPELEERLAEVMKKVLDDIAADEKQILFREGKDEISLSTGEILYFERNLRKTIVNTRDGFYEVQEKLSDIARRLPALQFVRCHHSYLVSVSAIRKLGRESMELSDGTVIPISRRYQKEVKDGFALWLSLHT